VDDLIHGQAAIEERARFELGMIKKNEIFFQVMEPAPKGLTSGTAAP
jgi:cell division protein FtsB